MGNRRTKGFTLMELLVVIAIIMILMGLMMPAINMAREKARTAKQKAMFRSMEVGLEMFFGDMESYPSSYAVQGTKVPPPGEFTVGAQKLAEALLGRDGYGFDPLSSWNAYYDEHIRKDSRDVYADKERSSDKQVEASLARRKGPYIPKDKVTVVKLGDLYVDTMLIYKEAPVICDIYNAKTVAVEFESEQGVTAQRVTTEVGTPILYYKANKNAKELKQIYISSDNQLLIDLGMMNNQLEKHNYDSEHSPVGNGVDLFYDSITNPKMTMKKTPHNVDSFILLSAGADGKFGTSDDITNF